MSASKKLETWTKSRDPCGSMMSQLRKEASQKQDTLKLKILETRYQLKE